MKLFRLLLLMVVLFVNVPATSVFAQDGDSTKPVCLPQDYPVDNETAMITVARNGVQPNGVIYFYRILTVFRYKDHCSVSGQIMFADKADALVTDETLFNSSSSVFSMTMWEDHMFLTFSPPQMTNLFNFYINSDNNGPTVVEYVLEPVMGGWQITEIHSEYLDANLKSEGAAMPQFSTVVLTFGSVDR